MKVVSIKEPFATLINNGFKKIETRSWKTNYRGKILIHAGKSLEKEQYKKFKDYNIECSCGEIIGEAYLTDCIKVTEDFDKELKRKDSIVYGNSGHVENYAWHLENIKKYEKKIKVNGKLGLWNYEK